MFHSSIIFHSISSIFFFTTTKKKRKQNYEYIVKIHATVSTKVIFNARNFVKILSLNLKLNSHSQIISLIIENHLQA